MKGWAQRYEGESVSTDDFIAFVDRNVRGDLTTFLRDWLYGTETSPMPGHPDWETAGAPVATATAARASSAARRRRRRCPARSGPGPSPMLVTPPEAMLPIER